MAKIIERLPVLRHEFRESEKWKRTFITEGRDEYGSAGRGLASDLRLLAACDYVLDNNKAGFRAKLSESIRLYMETLHRYDRGDSIDWSHVSMVCFRELLDALATGDLEIARQFAELIGGREEAERRNDNPFLTAMGYGLKSAVLHDEPGLQRYAADLVWLTQQKEWKRFAGYGTFLEALGQRDVRVMTRSIQLLIKTLPGACRMGIYLPADEALFLYGIGLTNLARGIWNIDLPAHPPLIPEDLLIPIGE